MTRREQILKAAEFSQSTLSSESKPREFWLVEMEGTLEVCSEESVFANTQVHVIEMKAYLALQKELDAANTTADHYKHLYEDLLESQIDKASSNDTTK